MGALCCCLGQAGVVVRAAVPAPKVPKKDQGIAPENVTLEPGKKTVILIHGLAGSAMTFSSEKCLDCGGDGKHVADLMTCCTCKGTGKTPPETEDSPSWCDISMFLWGPRSFVQGLMCEVKMEDGLPKAVDGDGFTVHVVEGAKGIATVNPFDKYARVLCFEPMIDVLSKDYNVLCLNYDWRKFGCPHYSKTILPRFKFLVEKANRETGHKVTIVGHSMGCGVTTLCMSDAGEQWQKDFVEDVILVAPANMGSPSMLSSLGFSPIVNSSSFFEHLKLGDGLAQASATWPCMIQEVPLPVAGINCFHEDHVFAFTSEKKYKLADMEAFLRDMADEAKKRGKKRDFGPLFYPHAKANADRMEPPVVPISLIFNDHHDTVSTLNYAAIDNDLLGCPELQLGKKGDGTIVAESVVRMGLEWRKMGRDVTIINSPDENNHRDLAGGAYTVATIDKIMRGVDVKDRREFRLVDEIPCDELSRKHNSFFTS